MTTQQGNIIVVGKKDNGVFHNGARFNEFAKPVIHPPPPGCPPNALQQLQMEKGPMEIIVPQTHDNKAFQQ
ncbi:DAZ associated protein 2 [Mactra antiquata]